MLGEQLARLSRALRARPHGSDALEARAARAVEGREERCKEDAATRRALREERASAAASRRSISEARAFIGQGRRQPSANSGDSGGNSPISSAAMALVESDPAVRRARSLCTGASNVVAMLEEQDRAMKRRLEAASASAPGRPSMPAPAPRKLANSEDDALLARARELLSDYHPPELQRRPAVPVARHHQPLSPPAAASASSTSSELERAKQLCAEVSIEMGKRGNFRRS